MTTPNQTPNNEAYPPQQVGSDWNQDVTEESVKQWARDQVAPGFGKAFTGQFDLFNMIIGGIFNGWFGSGSVGDPLEVEYTVEAIKDAVLAGYNVSTFAFSDTWVVPECIELNAMLIGGGETGADGQQTGQTLKEYSVPGRGGGFIYVPLDYEQLIGETLSITVGQAGAATTVKWGATELASANPGTNGGIAAGLAFAPSTSAPGSGGGGGYGATGGNNTADQWQVDGLRGTSSAIGAGGAGGLKTTGNGGNGGHGASVSAAARVKCGGGGGGGGAGGGFGNIGQRSGNGGAGGPGGYPGGGGGGGGGRGGYTFGGSEGNAGAGGIGAPGCAWLIWK